MNLLKHRSIVFAVAFVLFASFNPSITSGQAKTLVAEGDSITFYRTSLDVADNGFSIDYRQDGREKTGQYVVIAATSKIEAEDIVTPLFVQQHMVKALLDKCAGQGQDKCTVEDTSAFQYRQDNDKTNRFLVFHEKTNKPYQHRFISTSIASKFAIGADALAESAGGILPAAQTASAAFRGFVDLAEDLFGDYLRDF
jgi:hypothetical protein